MISNIDIEDMTDAQGPDTAKLQQMRDANWRPAVDYWRERAMKAEADLARPSQAGDERVKRLIEAVRGLLHYEIAHVGPYAVLRVAEVRAALAAMDTPKGGGE